MYRYRNLNKEVVQLDIDAEWTHFNKKKITTKKDGKDGLNIDGVEYGLETEASDLSEEDATTLGDLSESEPEAEVTLFLGRIAVPATYTALSRSVRHGGRRQW